MCEGDSRFSTTVHYVITVEDRDGVKDDSHSLDGYDGFAYGVPRIGESISYEGKRYLVTDVVWSMAGEVLGYSAARAWGHGEGDLACVEIYVRRK